jgi:hypothetical protein
VPKQLLSRIKDFLNDTFICTLLIWVDCCSNAMALLIRTDHLFTPAGLSAYRLDSGVSIAAMR